MSAFVKLTAIVIGLIGLLAIVLFQSVLGCVLLPLGFLLIMWTVIQERNAKEDEEREWRRQMLEAQRGNQQPPQPRPHAGESELSKQAREARRKLDK